MALLLFFASALSFFDRQVLSVLAPSILADLGMNNVGYSYVVAAFTLSYSVMFTFGGRMIDYLGTRRGMGLTVAFWSLASLLHAGAASALHLGALRFLLGAGEGGCFPGAAKGVAEEFPPRERALGMGIATTGGSAMGAVLAPPAIVWIAARAGWRGAFLLTGILGAVWVAAWFALVRAPRANSAAAASRETAPGWRSLLRARQLWGVVAARFLFDPVFYFYMFWIPQYLSRERGASLEVIGRLTWIPFLTLGVSSIFAGAVSGRLLRAGWSLDRTRKTVLAAAAFLTPISALSVWAPDAGYAIALMSVLMFAHGFWMTNYMTLLSDLFPSSAVATVVGLTGTAGGLGGFLSNLAIGRVVENAGFKPAFVACGAVYPLALAILLATVRRVERIDLLCDRGPAR
ncbi:MAG: MFS transporter [Acidobacteria bacterium]|nr:MFS transporter [Acidobacteriota bacterium]